MSEIDYEDERLGEFIEGFYSGRVNRNDLKGSSYKISKCRSCQLIYQPEVLNGEGLEKLYNNWIDSRKSLNKKQTAKTRLFKQYAGQMELISGLFSKSPGQIKVFEFGLGWGYWSRMAQAFGYRVSGYELSEIRKNHARSMGVNVIDELVSDGSVYDFIYSSQVFEHLLDPLGTLIQLRERLANSGYIYLRVPDGRHVESILRQSGWSPELDAIHPLEHINCFSRSSLTYMASCAGLTVANPPVRLHLGSIWGGLKREINDRFLTTHMLFKPAD